MIFIQNLFALYKIYLSIAVLHSKNPYFKAAAVFIQFFMPKDDLFASTQ